MVDRDSDSQPAPESLERLRRAALEATFDMGRDVTDMTDEEFIAALTRE